MIKRINFYKFNIASYLNIILLFFLLCSTLFLSSTLFFDKEILIKQYSFVFGSILFSLVAFYRNRNNSIAITLLDIFLLILFVYVLINNRLRGIGVCKNEIIFSCFIILYISFKIEKPTQRLYTYIAVLSLCQSLLGIVQYFTSDSVMSIRLVGNYDNPAGLALSLVACLPICISLINNSDIRQRVLGVLSTSIALLAILLSTSRTGIISALLIIGICFKNKQIKRLLLILYFIVAIVLLILKWDSALGRFFIWRNTLKIISDSLLFGKGQGGFLSSYMLYQADYFVENPSSKYSMLADNISHPLNEYLLFMVQYGLVGSIILIILVYVVVRSVSKVRKVEVCSIGLCAMAICALFSYPLRYPFILIMIAYSLANISIEPIAFIKNSLIIRIACLVPCICIILFSVLSLKFEAKWNHIFKNIESLSNEETCLLYEDLNSSDYKTPLFLYNYAAVLNMRNEYEHSIHILNECVKFLNDYDVQILYADNHHKLGHYAEAEYYYKLSHMMVPNRFYPLYELMILYGDIGDFDGQFLIANKLLIKESKVDSPAISYIRNKADKIVKVLSVNSN
ncbi:MAG: O-antigen ligase family protein [Bacteroidales bacterium]|nr:O-antigen ligase family protein [Bacteroidales bacterium]